MLIGRACLMAVVVAALVAASAAASPSAGAPGATPASASAEAPRATPAPPAGILRLGAGMTELGTHTEYDSTTANQGGPHQYYRDILIEGRAGEGAEHLIRREVGVLRRAGLKYTGSVGSAPAGQGGLPGAGEAIAVPLGTPGATSYVFDRSRQVCAVLLTYSDSYPPGDRAIERLAAGHRTADLVWVQLDHDAGEAICSLPIELRVR